MNKYLIHKDTSQLCKLNWRPVPFQMIWSTQVMDGWLMAMNGGRPECSWMPDTVHELGHLGLGHWFEPQAMPGRTAARLCNVSAVGGKSFCLLQFILGFGVQKPVSGSGAKTPSDCKTHSWFPLLSFPGPVHLLCAVLGRTKAYLNAFAKVATWL